jgi:hypothetical protein
MYYPPFQILHIYPITPVVNLIFSIKGKGNIENH